MEPHGWARRVLQVYDEAENDDVREALSSLSASTDASLVLLLVQKVLPLLLVRPLEEDMEEQIIVLLGDAKPPTQCFLLLSAALHEFAAASLQPISASIILIRAFHRILLKEMAVQIIRDVIESLIYDARYISDSQATLGTMSQVLHLPDVASNVLQGSFSDAPSLRHNRFYCTVAEATLLIVRDIELDNEIPGLLPGFLGRMISVTGGELFVQTAMKSKTPTLSLSKFASLVPLKEFRAFLQISLQSAENIPDFHEAFSERLCDPETFRMAATLPLKRPIMSRHGLALLRDTLLSSLARTSNRAVFDDAVYLVATLWSNEALYLSNDLELHGQVTRFLLLLLQQQEKLHSPTKRTIFLLARGVQEHLGLQSDVARWFGMLVGEAFSRYIRETDVLRFDRSNNLDTEGFEDLEDIAREGQRVKLSLHSDTLAIVNEANKASFVQENNDTTRTEDDDDFLPYEASSSEEDETDERLAKKIAVPSSLPRLLSLLRQFNREEQELLHDAELLECLLKKIIDATKSPATYPGISKFCPEFARGLLVLNPTRYPEEQERALELLRKNSLHAVAVCHPGGVCGMFLHSFLFRKGTLQTHRREILSLTATTARSICGRIDKTEEKEAEETVSEPTKTVGRTTRKLARSLAKSTEAEKITENKFAPLAESFFNAVYQGLRRPESTVDYGNIDAAFLAQGIAVLSVFLTCAGPQCPARDSLAKSAVELCVVERHHLAPEVRRAVFLLLGAAFESMYHDSLIDLQMSYSARQIDIMGFLLEAAEQDSDQGVRSYSHHAASKLSAVSQDRRNSLQLE